jgi:hypothetical protein
VTDFGGGTSSCLQMARTVSTNDAGHGLAVERLPTDRQTGRHACTVTVRSLSNPGLLHFASAETGERASRGLRSWLYRPLMWTNRSRQSSGIC